MGILFHLRTFSHAPIIANEIFGDLLPVPSMIFESSESISFKAEFNCFLKIIFPGTIFSIYIIRNSEKGDQ